MGNDGNAFAIMGACRKAARRAQVPAEEIELFASGIAPAAITTNCCKPAWHGSTSAKGKRVETLKHWRW